MQCWEFKKCGKDKPDGCPAYPDGGRECWRVAGTLCNGEVQGSFAQKLVYCMGCDFYRIAKGMA